MEYLVGAEQPYDSEIDPESENTQAREVDLIASGYEWTCPACGKINTIDGYNETVRCSQCRLSFRATPPEHAFN